MPSPGAMPEMAQGGDAMPEMAQGNAQADRTQVDAQTEEGFVARVKRIASDAAQSVQAWLYEGVDTSTAQNVTGSLVKVEVGMQNDDYAEILSGVSEGDVLLYTQTDTGSGMYGSMMAMPMF